ncbi:MFS transporter [Mucilaginibacter sp. HMF7410]|uniref:MFS transporter n=2 Tax=Mucilaginibacter arboris TaxID=2682090 RepID=A0A7K1SUV7_9SPHI|nr:MFS transporter [Mucilaginibacter arboris]
MTVTTGLVVANLYYGQPLLSDIARTYHVSSGEAGSSAMLTQMGYAFGMLLIVPLGDMLKRKKLIMIDFSLIIISLLLAAFAPSFTVMLIASFLIGFTSVIPQLIIPMAAHLSKPNERGKTVGFVMSGLLIGILLSRTISGYIGQLFGWHVMYMIAAGLMLLLWVIIYFLFPEIEPQYKGNYPELMRSLITLIQTEPLLRLAALRGALCYACFGAFWTTLVFLLRQPQFNLGSEAAGLFGLVGAFGALGAALMGRVSDKTNPYTVTTLSILLIIVSFIVFFFSDSSLTGLIIGVILLDLGVQATHISNQTTIFSLSAEARNRLNTVYMVTYFLGGAGGTFLASRVWNTWHWHGVAGIGIVLSVAALFVHFSYRKTVRLNLKLN